MDILYLYLEEKKFTIKQKGKLLKMFQINLIVLSTPRQLMIKSKNIFF